jgi:hypothetical protein
MGTAIVKPIPPRAPNVSGKERVGGFSFIVVIPSVFSHLYQSDYSTWNILIARRAICFLILQTSFSIVLFPFHFLLYLRFEQVEQKMKWK